MSSKKLHNAIIFSDIISRIKEVEKVQLDKDVQKILGLKQGTFAAGKKRNSIPFDELIAYCNNKNINLMWLLTGEGEPFTVASKTRDCAACDNVVEITADRHHLHHRLINEFLDKDKAYRFNQVLAQIERYDPDTYNEMLNYAEGRRDQIIKARGKPKSKTGNGDSRPD